MKVAYVHDWLVTYRGGEKVLQALLELYPDAPIFTLFYDPDQMPIAIKSRHVIYPKWLQPLARWRKQLLPILPLIVETFPLEEYDLIISSSSCVAKGVIPGPRSKHISYIHSPMRYIWDQRGHYIAPKSPIVRPLIHAVSTLLRLWDSSTSQRVDKMIANSTFIAGRIRKYYNRPATVIFPPIETQSFASTPAKKDDYFVIAGAFVPYKGFDLAIRACEKIGQKLIVVGSGPEEAHLRAIAGSHTSFVIHPDDKTFSQILSQAKALLFPGIEDFGMIAIEAMAAGTPVIALKGGGALDFIQPGRTGLFFDAPLVQDLATVIQTFNPNDFHEQELQTFATRFNKKRFLEEFEQELQTLLRQPN